MTNTDRETILWRVADGVGAMELNFQRAVGASYTDAYLADWAVTAVTYKMLLADHRPAVHEPARIIQQGQGRLA